MNSKYLKIDEYVDPNRKSREKEYVQSHMLYLNPQDNGGEAVSITIHVYNNGDGPGGWWFQTEINTQCYGSHSSIISLSSGFNTRNLADIGMYLIKLSYAYPNSSDAENKVA